MVTLRPPEARAWPQPVATARSAIVVSSVSPLRCDITQRHPPLVDSAIAASVSVSVPIWFTLISTALAEPSATPRRMRSTFVTNTSSPTSCTRAPSPAATGGRPGEGGGAEGGHHELLEVHGARGVTAAVQDIELRQRHELGVPAR